MDPFLETLYIIEKICRAAALLGFLYLTWRMLTLCDDVIPWCVYSLCLSALALACFLIVPEVFP